MRLFFSKRFHQWLGVAFALSLMAQTPQPSPIIPAPPEPWEKERPAITQTALDYVEGWYEGNAERMERALHPDLAKRIVRGDFKVGPNRLDQMSALTLVQAVRKGFGKATPKEKQQKDVIILDIYQNVATVKAVMADWVDYMHMAKWNGRWVIVNVLWELKPKPQK